VLPILTDDLFVLRAELVTGYGGSRVRDWPNASRTPSPASVQPSSSSESKSRGDRVETTLRVFLPPGTDVVATDRIEWHGTVYDIHGEPMRWPSPFSGGEHHVELQMRKVTGG
jgi:head-tail adaptor